PDDVAERALRAIDDIRDRHARGNVLIVSHKAVLRILLCRMLRLDLREYRTIDWPVAALTRLDLDGDRLSLHTFAVVSSLTGGRPWPGPRRRLLLRGLGDAGLAAPGAAAGAAAGRRGEARAGAGGAPPPLAEAGGGGGGPPGGAAPPRGGGGGGDGGVGRGGL